MPTLVWRGLDAPRMEVAHVDSLERARGAQIGVRYELRWALHGDVLKVETVGAGQREIGLDGADFFDLAYSPFFNSLPVMRDGLLDGGEPHDYRMRFVDVPGLSDELSTQRYDPLGHGVVRYRSGTFEAEIEFGADGFVSLYEGLVERL